MSLYVEVMCDVGCSNNPRCLTFRNDNPRGSSIREARSSARRSGWKLGQITENGVRDICPECLRSRARAGEANTQLAMPPPKPGNARSPVCEDARNALAEIAALGDGRKLNWGDALDAAEIAKTALSKTPPREDAREELVEASYCEQCDCDLCRAQQKVHRIAEAIEQAKLPGSRCWSCSCGWLSCYTPAEITEYGEPPECGDCYRERLVEQDASTVAALAKASPPGASS